MSVSLNPQTVSPYIWYYEHKGSIEVVIDTGDGRRMVEEQEHGLGNSVIVFRIRKSQLNKSLARMNGKGPRRKG